jgi:hypothetical protein
VTDVHEGRDPGHTRQMPSPPSALAAQVRHVLSEAGFYLVAETDDGMPGLRVSEVPEGVLVRWAASDEFTALAASQPGRASNDGMRAWCRGVLPS